MPEVDSQLQEQAKETEKFRNYVDSDRQNIVINHYRMMRQNQTVDFVKKMMKKYTFDKPRAMLSIEEVMKKLEGYVDSSDPDMSLPNILHAFQTAEGIRRAGKPDWMQLVGLLHDFGKVMFLWGAEEDGQVGTAAGPQWALGGDTWVVGARIPDSCVFPEFTHSNPDMANPLYNTELGIYQPHCGMHNLMYAYGHDEYMYQMLVANKSTIPKEGLAMVRFHSCYPWHTGGAYRQFMTQEDEELMQAVLDFNKFDLYTKDDSGKLTAPVEELWIYYKGLIDKYFPTEKLMW
jgi:inositol oxygenase